MEFQTARLWIRPLTEADREDVIDLLMDQRVKQTYMVPDFAGRAEAGALFVRLKERSAQKDRYVAGICLDGKAIGLIHETEVTGSSIELGYAILPSYHNRGYATEALTGAVGWLFDRGFAQVTAGAFEENPASLRVMEKSGMTRLDRWDTVEYRGRTHRCVYCGIQKQD